jgi:hypothetical protein
MNGDVLFHLILAAIAGLCAVIALVKMIQELTLPRRMRRKYGVQLPERGKLDS